jgi:AraC family transcriptional regulator of adaptative response/methylated-DNA-[protein]-cysteine methyltransferase
MKRAVQTSDATYDGIFLVAVRTTGIFCRPSCPARKPLPRNCEYYASAREALFAGFRPCKRCRPLETDGRAPDWVARLLSEVDRAPATRWRDADLRKRHIDPARARRYFNKHYGMTFQAYCRGRRMGEALQQIRGGARLDDVALGYGYDSHSGFREAFQRTFGQPPGRSRQTDCLIVSWVESPLGPLLVASTPSPLPLSPKRERGRGDGGICLLEFTDRRALETQFRTLRRRFDRAIVPGKSDHIEQMKRELAEYFAGERTVFEVPIVYPGSPFQQSVWEQLLRIPYGETRSYEDVAVALGKTGAQRAVGMANGQNRIAIVIPCHRVVNKGGKLGGYGGGLWRKQFLLDLEASARSQREGSDLGRNDSLSRSGGRPQNTRPNTQPVTMKNTNSDTARRFETSRHK